jgi:3-methyladenine DNA glycosylase AlkD
MDLKTALKQLESAGTDQNRKVYGKHGVQEPMHGVSFAALGKLKKAIKTDHPLARQLWTTGNHDARILATMIADALQMTEADLETWVGDLDNYVITDAFSKMAAQSSFARKKMQQWTRKPDEWMSTAGWNLLGLLAMDKNQPDDLLDSYVRRIEAEIHDAPNRTRHAMNGALIGIGSRGGSLAQKAVAAAKRIGKVEVDHGETGCQTPEAAPYIAKMLQHRDSKASKVGARSSAKKSAKKVKRIAARV